MVFSDMILMKHLSINPLATSHLILPFDVTELLKLRSGPQFERVWVEQYPAAEFSYAIFVDRTHGLNCDRVRIEIVTGSDISIYRLTVENVFQLIH